MRWSLLPSAQPLSKWHVTVTGAAGCWAGRAPRTLGAPKPQTIDERGSSSPWADMSTKIVCEEDADTAHDEEPDASARLAVSDVGQALDTHEASARRQAALADRAALRRANRQSWYYQEYDDAPWRSQSASSGDIRRKPPEAVAQATEAYWRQRTRSHSRDSWRGYGRQRQQQASSSRSRAPMRTRYFLQDGFTRGLEEKDA